MATTALEIDGPQPVWKTLNQARERAFTGEIVFEVEPEVVAYLDHGVVYYAERAVDAPLGQRLLDAGVVDATQLERGTVRIGELEHLGRLFDRDSSIDRHAVVVTAELFTEELIAELANQAVADIRVTAYRHHPSGVHRWFVAPADRSVVPRPLSAVGQLDGTVVDDLPSLLYGFEDDELTIEWDVIADTSTDADAEIADADAETDTVIDTDAVTDSEIEADTDVEIEIAVPDSELAYLEFDDVAMPELEPFEPVPSASDSAVAEPAVAEPDVAEDVAVEDVAVETSVEPTETEGSEEFDFSVVWPDESAEPADLSVLELDEVIETEPTFTETEDGELHFSMPPLTLSDEPEAADADVPDDVADAVRRAIAAIESAGADGSDELFQSHDVDESTGEAGMDAPTAATNGVSGFAPPSMATRAEVLYAQMSDDDAMVDEDGQALATGGDDHHGSGERESSLRRLIGSLRRKDN